ncbi:MAG TPA: transcription antitermination factor NusB, partial [Candidatus Saccharimonadales bacterium]
MASNRHLGRIIALQTLYECEFREQSNDETLKLEEVLARNLERYADTIEDKAFVERLVQGVFGTRAELDALIQPIAPEWPIEQIARVDRTI